ncbi:hypothetical protein BP5796_03911 [Coleophoma crateriformis]|uniref:DUF747-domain-containing protein n=1 Tax=Coleophoma crateriformis TaxID=565419 RepID=A0A3D8SH03_9HELO|nr:hypothetical protein BP5796_03911 [Coleophoma crateriformis]
MAQDTVEDSSHDLPPAYPEPPTESSTLRSRFLETNPNGQLSVFQLPSPSPSRSPSPPLIITDDSSAEWDGRLSITSNAGHKHSNSFEKIAIRAVESEDGKSASLPPVSRALSPHELHDIPEEPVRKPRNLSVTRGDEKILKLSPAEMQELTSAPESLPAASPRWPSIEQQPPLESPAIGQLPLTPELLAPVAEIHTRKNRSRSNSNSDPAKESIDRRPTVEEIQPPTMHRRPGFSSRTISSPPIPSNRISSFTKGTQAPSSPRRKPVGLGLRPDPLDLNSKSTPNSANRPVGPDPPSPIPQSIPLPPMSIPTYLQLELSQTRPSPLYIYRSASSDYPYESSRIKFERLLNFLLLPPQLEQVLYFGSLACLDAWLYTFTILPLRFFRALAVLIQWWFQLVNKEARFILGFIYHGTGRMWHRRREQRTNPDGSRSRSVSRSSRPPASTMPSYQSQSGRHIDIVTARSLPEQLRIATERKSRQGWGRKHRRSKSEPSTLSSYHKADLLEGAVIICSCVILLKLDASRMYHSIRGQAAIKLYVIYNVLEVCDRLFSALGQDIFECLFSDETLERNSNGRSKVLRPLGMFFLALAYNVIHAAALFYQVITLNVAVNSYSNALLTLLMSNQFVEIKSTVFKKFEKDNLFQLTCADVVERFQLWLMLMIIACRNIVEVGGLSALSNASDEVTKSGPIRSNSMLPNSFQILPSWPGELLSPFLIVLGSEMLVDWVKHAYISKFNSVKPAVYQRFLDVLAKDYYTNAFVNQNLIKRLGLPVVPLSCLFIRASVQTYHMFLATHMPPPIPSTATALSLENAPTPVTTAAFEHFDNIIRSALGRSAFGIPDPAASGPWYLPSADDVIASLTMLVFFSGAFLVLLAFKLVLGMLLLKFARNRYSSMKKREHMTYDTGGKRVGGWGMVEVDDDKKRWIYDDDPETLRKLKERERSSKEKAEKGGSAMDFSKISRYEMSAKRIW